MVGKTISHYKILEKLGEGGMGIVYKAEDTKLKRQVALKFLPKNLMQNPEGQKRFVQEAQAAAALNQPNICTVYEIDKVGGQSFIAMEYIEGQTLQEKIRAGSLNLDDVLKIAIQVAHGLSAAHDKAIVHRDIKSANIMVTSEGDVKIMDFGLARFSAVATMLTKEGTTLGTTAYMSPEQTHGMRLDHRTDIWSFGVVVYEMLTGVLPFRGDYEQAIVYSIVNEEPEPVTALRLEIPTEFDQILQKSFAKEADERYQHVDDMLVELRSLQRKLEAGTTKEKEKLVPSIAVLPFVNMNRDEESEFFSDGITEDIITALAKLEGLRVAARNSAFQFKGKTPDLPEIGRKLKVTSVLTGSFRRAGKKLRITVQLSNLSDGYEMWSERYDQVMEDIFNVQDEISQAVVEALKVKLVGDEKKQLAKRHTEDIEAYNFYLKGRYHWNQRTPESILKAKEFFERALIEDSNYALAHSGLSDCYGALGILGGFTPNEIITKGRAAAQKALEIEPSLAEAHTSLAFIEVIYNWNWELADRELQRAKELNPNYATAPFWRAIFVLTGTGRHKEAEAEARLAREKQPTTAFIDHGVGWVLFYARKYDKAIRELKITLELDPTYHYAHWTLGRAYLQKGNHQKALSEFDKIQGLTLREGYIGYAYAVSGQRQKARKILNELRAGAGPDHLVAYQIAVIYSGLGEKDLAFEWLEKAYEAHSPLLVWIKVAPEFDPLHRDPRWKNLMKRMGLAR